MPVTRNYIAGLRGAPDAKMVSPNPNPITSPSPNPIPNPAPKPAPNPNPNSNPNQAVVNLTVDPQTTIGRYR